MGAGIAQLLALNGFPCSLSDASLAQAERARDRLLEAAAGFETRGLMPAGAAERIAEQVRAADSPEGAAFVIEAVPESPELKAGVHARIEAAVPRDAVIASNTSAIPIGQLAAGFEHRERFLGTHWFNPPQWVPCVEIIPAEHTAPEAVDVAETVLRALGKHPTTVGDAAGFVANRIQFAMFKEAVSVVADGVATAEQVDEIVRSSFGFRLPFFGPFAIADMAGLDVYTGAYAALERDLGERFSVPAALRELVEAGKLGTKSGGGFLDIPADDVPALTERRDTAYAELTRLRDRLAGGDGAERSAGA